MRRTAVERLFSGSAACVLSCVCVYCSLSTGLCNFLFVSSVSCDSLVDGVMPL